MSGKDPLSDMKMLRGQYGVKRDTEDTMSFLVISCVVRIISLVRGCCFSYIPYYLNIKVLIIPEKGPLSNMKMF